jgi:hypothetical protein
MLLGDGGSLLNCRQNARWTEIDSCSTNCSTQNAFCSGVAIIALLRHRPSEKRGVGLRMRTKLEHLLFRSMWETYVCVCFESRNGRLKLLQSFWYTLYLLNTNFNIVFPFTPWFFKHSPPSDSPTKTLYAFPFSHSCRIPRPHTILDWSLYIWCEAKTTLSPHHSISFSLLLPPRL